MDKHTDIETQGAFQGSTAAGGQLSQGKSPAEEPAAADASVAAGASAASFSLLFRTFFKIGAFTLGGGYAMIPIIQSEIVEKYKWIKDEEFLDLVAIAQSCPGVFAVNIATFIGYKLRQGRGALCTTLGAVLPSFLIILAIAMFFHRFMDIGWVAAMFRGIRPAVVALIAVPTFNLAKSAHIGWGNCWIPIASALLIWQLGVNPVWIIIAAGVGGFLVGRYLK